MLSLNDDVYIKNTETYRYYLFRPKSGNDSCLIQCTGYELVVCVTVSRRLLQEKSGIKTPTD